MHNSKGFTVVELIASIVLLGILSATGMSRWFNSDSFDASTAKNQLIGQARLAQRIALAHANVDIHLEISLVAGEWRYRVIEDDGGTLTTLHDLAVDAGDFGISVTAGGGPVSLSATSSMNMTFDTLGNASAITLAGVPGSTASGVLLSFTATHQMCVSPLGYSHSGNCV